MGDVTRRDALAGILTAVFAKDSLAQGCGAPSTGKLPFIGVRLEDGQRIPYISHGDLTADKNPDTGKLEIYSMVKCAQDPEVNKA